VNRHTYAFGRSDGYRHAVRDQHRRARDVVGGESGIRVGKGAPGAVAVRAAPYERHVTSVNLVHTGHHEVAGHRTRARGSGFDPGALVAVGAAGPKCEHRRPGQAQGRLH